MNLEHRRRDIRLRLRKLHNKLNDIWRYYRLNDSALVLLRSGLKSGEVTNFKMIDAALKINRETRPDKLISLIDNELNRYLPEKTFLDLVFEAEHFFQDVATMNYTNFPDRLESKNTKESEERQDKLLTLILKSETKDLMIDALIEEKVRSIFYGNPLDYFTKDKAKLRFKDYFKKNHLKAMEALSEVFSRRNILVHNDGIVDRKYIKDNPNTTHSRGDQLNVDKEYLSQTLLLFRGLGAVVYKLVKERNYEEKVGDGLNSEIEKFKKRFD